MSKINHNVVKKLRDPKGYVLIGEKVAGKKDSFYVLDMRGKNIFDRILRLLDRLLTRIEVLFDPNRSFISQKTAKKLVQRVFVQMHTEYLAVKKFFKPLVNRSAEIQKSIDEIRSKIDQFCEKKPQVMRQDSIEIRDYTAQGKIQDELNAFIGNLPEKSQKALVKRLEPHLAKPDFKAISQELETFGKGLSLVETVENIRKQVRDEVEFPKLSWQTNPLNQNDSQKGDGVS